VDRSRRSGDRGAARPEPSSGARAKAAKWGSSRRQLGCRDPRGARRLAPRKAFRSTTAGSAHSRSAESARSSSSSTSASSSSSKTAMRSSRLCCSPETQYPPARLTSILHYGGLPMDHRCVTEALEQYAAQGVAA
jgi:hypothetical protein